jgi:hypothetical protein
VTPHGLAASGQRHLDRTPAVGVAIGGAGGVLVWEDPQRRPQPRAQTATTPGGRPGRGPLARDTPTKITTLPPGRSSGRGRSCGRSNTGDEWPFCSRRTRRIRSLCAKTNEGDVDHGSANVVDRATWRKELDALRVHEKAATRELDAIAAQRRRLAMARMTDYTLIGTVLFRLANWERRHASQLCTATG